MAPINGVMIRSSRIGRDNRPPRTIHHRHARYSTGSPPAVISPPVTIAQAATSQTKRYDGKVRPDDGGDANGDIEQSFKYQQSPAVLLAAIARTAEMISGNAIDQHIGGEQQHQRPASSGGKDQREQSEDNAEDASQQE